MPIREFLTWSARADAEARADAAGALARAYLYADLGAGDAADALRALTLLLDDPSPLVRRVMAEAFATAAEAPRHILSALAADRSDIAVIVLQRSLLLSDQELIDAVAVGDAVCQFAVARRPVLSAAVAGAIAEVGGLGAVMAVACNAGAALTDFAIRRMIERFGDHGPLRESLVKRDDVGPEMRHVIVLATAKALGRFALECGWISPERIGRVLAEACDRAAVTIASTEVSVDLDGRRFVAYLRSNGHLTPALVLRGVLSGNLAMFEAVLCELSGKTEQRVGAFLRNPDGLGFAALYNAAGLPPGLMPAFRTALAVANRRKDQRAGREPRLDPHMVERVIETCEGGGRADGARLSALLRRFEMEAARDAARAGMPPEGSAATRERGEPPRLSFGVSRAAA